MRPYAWRRAGARPAAAALNLKNSKQAIFRKVLTQLRKNVAHIQAVILVGPEGVVDQMVEDSSLDIETIVGEYITLLHIARSASEDSGAGAIFENSDVSERSITVV